jgi:Fe2+ transport system protein FeoA
MSDISQRLCQFGIQHFGSKRGWKARFAEALEMGAGPLQMYLTGDRTPGNELHERLRKLGCDIEWLMTGKTEAGKKRVCTGEEEAMIERLRGMGITTLEQLEMFLDPKDIAQDLAFVLRERMAKYKIKYKKNKVTTWRLL